MKKIFISGIVILFMALTVQCKPGQKTPQKNSSADLPDFIPEVAFEGKIVFNSDMDGDHEIYVLTKKGLKKLTDNDWNDENPKWSPDGELICFTANPDGKYEIFFMTANGSQITQLTTTVKNPIGHAGHSWHPDGKRIAYSVERRKGLRRQHWMEMVHIRTKKIERLAPEIKKGIAIPDFSPTDPLVGVTAKQTIGWDVAIYHLQSKALTFLTDKGKSCRPHFSWDGKRIAYVSSLEDGKGDIWLMKPDGSQKVRLTRRDKTYDYFPAWSPDDRFIVFSSAPSHGKRLEGAWGLYLVSVESGRISLLLDTPGADLFPDWFK